MTAYRILGPSAFRRVAALVPIALVAAACGGTDHASDTEPPAAVSVAVSTSAPGTATASVSGAVTADRTARISTRMSGTLRSVEVDVGDRVRAGTPLLRLDDADLVARRAAVEAERNVASATFDRIAALAADGAAARQELDEARARLERAEAAVAEVESGFDYTVVRAPFDGTVASRAVDPGDLANPGQPLLTLVASGAPRIEFELPADFDGQLGIGDTLVARVEGADPAMIRVTRIAPSLDPATRRRHAEASFVGTPSERIVPGAFVAVDVPTGETTGLWVPRDAVVRRGQLTGVFAVENDRVRLRWLRLGREVGDAVEVLAGPGTTLSVVRSPGADVVDGAPVTAVDVIPWIAVGGTDR
jgi:RND family efflux transporter MFP subunit